MGDVAIAVIGFGGTIACLGLAYWVFARGRAQPRAVVEAKVDGQQSQVPAAVSGSVTTDPKTEFLSREDVLAGAQGQAPDLETAFLSREEVLAAAQRREDGQSTDPGTEFLSREEMLAAAQRRENGQSAEPGTEFLSREEVLAAAQRREQQQPPVPTTEFLSRDEVLAMAQRRAPATTLLSRDEALATAQREEPSPPQPMSAPSFGSPKFEPKHVPGPAPAATQSNQASGPPDIPTATLELHLQAALAAMDQLLEALAGAEPPMRELAAGPEQLWRGNVEVLSLTGKRVVEQMLLPVMRNRETPVQRRLATALTLLEIKGVAVPKLVLDLYAEMDEAGRSALLDALAYWEDPRADKTIILGLQRFAATDRSQWLNLCVERSCEIPAELLEQLLKEKQPNLLAAGLRLVALCAEADKYASVVDRHLVAGVAEVREPAILTGLALKRPTALIVSKQAARDPSMPLVCEALATTGSQADSNSLITWARTPGAPAHAGWVLGLLGRVDALDACVDRLDHTDTTVVDSALAGFRLATGFDGAAAKARSWWAEHRARFEDGGRHLAGEPITVALEKTALLTASAKQRQSFALELFLRSHGQVRLPLRRLPSVHVEIAGRL